VFLFPASTFLNFGKMLTTRIATHSKGKKHNEEKKGKLGYNLLKKSTKKVDTNKEDSSLRVVAEKCFNWAHLLDKNSAEPHIGMAFLLWECWNYLPERRGFNWREIVKHLDRALLINPKISIAAILLARIYWKNSSELFDLKKAESHVNYVLLNEPYNYTALVEISNVNLAMIWNGHVNTSPTILQFIIGNYQKALSIDWEV